jgi:hypothetical protein
VPPAAVADLAPGVTHRVVTDPAGPWTVHVVAVATARCAPVLEARKAPGRLSSLATTSELAGTALFGVNADFFRAPGGTPVGAHVHGGVPWSGPTEWPVFAMDAAGAIAAGRARLAGQVAVGGASAPLTQINRPATPFTAYQGTADGVALHTSRADTVPADSSARRIALRLVAGDERAGSAIVMAVDSPAPRTFVRPGEAVLLVRGRARGWGAQRAPGDSVAWEAAVVVDDGSGTAITAYEAVGGFPVLLAGGRDVLGLQTVRRAFGDERHPRTALGWSGRGARFFFVVVDGRQEHSVGMTLPELTAFMRRLGATEAINLDGGGSTALVIRGRLANRPSDAAGERRVGNALALARCR